VHHGAIAEDLHLAVARSSPVVASELADEVAANTPPFEPVCPAEAGLVPASSISITLAPQPADPLVPASAQSHVPAATASPNPAVPGAKRRLQKVESARAGRPVRKSAPVPPATASSHRSTRMTHTLRVAAAATRRRA
jgi:hypothetical protein